MTRPRLVLLLLAIGAMVLAGQLVRRGLGIEASTESVQTFVEGLGWIAPAGFAFLVGLRPFLGIPTFLLLLAGGLCFGAGIATAAGGVGILASGLLCFGLARAFGRDALPRNAARFLERAEEQLRSGGPLVVGIATAHPMAPMSAFHVAAGLLSLPFLQFAVAVAVAGPARAFAISFFGASLGDLGSGGILIASAVFVGLALVPLAHPGLRARVFQLGARRADAAPERDGSG